MYFGSVRFFKHLILTVAALLIIVPTVLCIILFIDNAKKSAEIEQLNSAIAGYNQSDCVTESSSEQADSELSVTQSDTSSKNDTLSDSEENSDRSDISGEAETDDTSSEAESSSTSSKAESSSTSSEAESVPKVDVTALYPDLYVKPYDGEYENSQNTVYLTFDDGPSILTENLLYYLNKQNIKATFFVVPERTEYCYSLLKKIANGGHTIGIHTASHDYEKIYSSVEAYLDDFNEAYTIVAEATGLSPDIYRFPGGSVNDYNSETREEIITEMSRRGFVYFDWNVDSDDWQGLKWTQLYNNILSDCEEFSSPVVLFHNTGDRENTIYVIEDIIIALKQKGYKFGTLSQKVQPVHF